MALSNQSTSRIMLAQTTTYQAGILYAQSFRELKRINNRILKDHDLTMMQWLVLGLIYDAGAIGTRMTEIAQSLDTTNAYITNTINILEAKGFVSRFVSDTDNRSKFVKISPRHKKSVRQIEQDLREGLRQTLYKRVSRQDLETFIQVLERFARS